MPCSNSQNLISFLVQSPGYTPVYLTRKSFLKTILPIEEYKPGKPHGCVFILVNDKIVSSEETVLSVEGAEMVWDKVLVVGMGDLYLCSFYRPPSSDIEYLDKVNESLNRISNTNSKVWLGGDINLPYFNWDTESVTDKCKIPITDLSMKNS